MSSREKILEAVRRNQPAFSSLPALEKIKAVRFDDPLGNFVSTLEGIGAKVLRAREQQEVTAFVQTNFQGLIICAVDGWEGIQKVVPSADPHSLENVEAAIVKASFGVAENGALWMDRSALLPRALPFICQHLVAVVRQDDIVHNMHEAYEMIGEQGYDYGVFIAGPSKTADIEQSLVLGAHGPKTMTVFVLEG